MNPIGAFCRKQNQRDTGQHEKRVYQTFFTVRTWACLFFGWQRIWRTCRFCRYQRLEHAGTWYFRHNFTELRYGHSSDQCAGHRDRHHFQRPHRLRHAYECVTHIVVFGSAPWDFRFPSLCTEPVYRSSTDHNRANHYLVFDDSLYVARLGLRTA